MAVAPHISGLNTLDTGAVGATASSSGDEAQAEAEGAGLNVIRTPFRETAM